MLAIGLKHSKAGKAQRKIRRLTRALGGVRELDVTLRLLGELAQAAALPRTAIEEVRAHVIAERNRRRTAMLGRLDDVNVDKLGRRLTSVAEALQATDSEEWRDVLSARLLKRSQRLGEAIGHAGQMYVPERLHDVRITAKKLRYAIELAADSRVAGASALLRPIKRVQDLLGRLHDLQVLQSHVAEVQAAPRASRPGMHASLDAVTRQLEDECRHLHGRYLMSAGSLQEVCDRIVSDLVPLLEAPPVRRRVLKMALPRKAVRAAGGGRQ